jgi:hypothetical protein
MFTDRGRTQRVSGECRLAKIDKKDCRSASGQHRRRRSKAHPADRVERTRMQIVGNNQSLYRSPGSANGHRRVPVVAPALLPVCLVLPGCLHSQEWLCHECRCAWVSLECLHSRRRKRGGWCERNAKKRKRRLGGGISAVIPSERSDEESLFVFLACLRSGLPLSGSSAGMTT